MDFSPSSRAVGSHTDALLKKHQAVTSGRFINNVEVESMLSRLTIRPVVTSLFVLLYLRASASDSTAQFHFPGPVFDVAYQPTAMAVGDINGDGRLDVVTAGIPNSSVSVLKNPGDVWETDTTMRSPTFRWLSFWEM
jgi:hypothetical protein